MPLSPVDKPIRGRGTSNNPPNRFESTRYELEVDWSDVPVAVITKNLLITRDIDLFQELAKYNAIVTTLSITTLDTDLARVMEPRSATPAARLAAIEKLASAGILVGVNVAPVIPGLTDHELPAIIDAAVKAGATFAHFVPLRLPYAVKDLFVSWLEQHFPLRKEKVLAQIRAIRGGKLNDPNFGSRMQGEGIFAEQIQQIFEVARRKAGIEHNNLELSIDNFVRPRGFQLQLDFES